MYTACSRSGPPVLTRWQRTRWSTLLTAGIALILALGPVACSRESMGTPLPAPEPELTDQAQVLQLRGDGTLTEPGRQSGKALTYNTTVAPAGARVALTVTGAQRSTVATFYVVGLLPNRGYAVHLHTKVCGTTGDAAGPHFQHRVDPAATPEQPSTDPEYANSRNEIWLDINTDATGSAMARAEVPFVFTDRLPGSVVVHEERKTATEPGKAGKAGARVACFTLARQ